MNGFEDLGGPFDNMEIVEFICTNITTAQIASVTVIDGRQSSDELDYHMMMGLSSAFETDLIAFILNSEIALFAMEAYSQFECADPEEYLTALIACVKYMQQNTDSLANRFKVERVNELVEVATNDTLVTLKLVMAKTLEEYVAEGHATIKTP